MGHPVFQELVATEEGSQALVQGERVQAAEELEARRPLEVRLLTIIVLNEMLVRCLQNNENGEMIGHDRQQGFNVFFKPLNIKILLEIKMNIPGSGCVGSPTVHNGPAVN